MNRLCLIDVAALSNRVLDLAPPGGTLDTLARRGRRSIRPACPAVTCTMQATLTTGATPANHGIIANGLYFADQARVSFWEQSDRLLDARRFWKGAELAGRCRSAMLFWQNSMFGAADTVVTPRPIHTPDGRTISSCYSTPASLYSKLREQLGEFELKHYWGPFAGLPATEWIARCAATVWDDLEPDLQLVYLPHLDYALQKVGPDDASIAAEVAAVDKLLGELLQTVQADGGEAIVLGDYGIVPVNRAALPNVALREAGLLPVRTIDGVDTLEIGEAGAFAMVDHQVAHVYCMDPAALHRAGEALCNLDGVAEVIDLTRDDTLGLAHPRSGQLLLLAEPDAWFGYYWWTDASAAPGFARTVDIHRKPGYDPCELFIDPAVRAISMDTSLVKGSHGLPDPSIADRPVLLSTADLPTSRSTLSATEIAPLLHRMLAPADAN